MIREHFELLIAVKPGDSLNYYGLNIEVHHTVHSIPTIGATFSTLHKGVFRDVCVVGDNQNMSAVRSLGAKRNGAPRNRRKPGAPVQPSLPFADCRWRRRRNPRRPHRCAEIEGGTRRLRARRQVPETLQTTFSLASSGKRYTLLEGDAMIYTSQINHYLTLWLGQPFPNRWMRNLLAEQELYRYNTDDVIIVQDASTHGAVYLILTGYCEVVRVEDGKREAVALLQSGDIIGEMAILTGSGVRNASVVAKTPVTVCVFAEETFRNFIRYSGLQTMLENRWLLRPVIKLLPQFAELSSTVTDKISRIAEWQVIEGGKTRHGSTTSTCIFLSRASDPDRAGAMAARKKLSTAKNSAGAPTAASRVVEITATTDCGLICIAARRLSEIADVDTPAELPDP